jgi:hypothetical protein
MKQKQKEKVCNHTAPTGRLIRLFCQTGSMFENMTPKREQIT